MSRTTPPFSRKRGGPAALGAALVTALWTGCAAPGAPPLVSAPSAAPVTRVTEGPAAAGSEKAAACDKPWNLDVIGGDGQVVVSCAHDVTRRPLGESPAIARALFPGLDPARERVCGCMTQVKAPPFVDLVFTADPVHGSVSVQAGGDEDLDPELGPAFVACVGTVVARFAPLTSDECPEPGKVAFIYPVRLDLAP